jgi:hypothetical protein
MIFMSFRTRRVLISVPFYMVFQFFLMKYVFLSIGIVHEDYLILFAVLMGLVRSFPTLIEAKKSTPFGRLVATIDGVWMWASLMLFICLIIIYSIRMFIVLPKELIYILLAFVLVLGVYNYYNAHKLVVNERTLKLDNLTSEVNIVHLSDVHFGSVRHREIIRQIASKLKELESSCDVAIISGDLADGSSVVEENDFLELREVNMPIVFTPGNHDFYPGLDSVIKACKNAGMIVLDNDNFEIKNLNIYGLTYSFDDIEMPSDDELKSKINPDMVNIINYHVPYQWDEFSSLGFDLQLSGHTHGGQFYPVIYISWKLFKYNMGLFKNDSSKYLHVTTGVGSMDTPMRWGTDSELVILKLRKR